MPDRKPDAACAFCQEPVYDIEGDVELATSATQWQCGCCGKWNDKPQKKIMIVCSECGSHDVQRDAFAEWDYDTQQWVVGPVFDQGYCENCQGEASLDEIEVTPEQAAAYPQYVEGRERMGEEALTFARWLDMERELAITTDPAEGG